MGLIVVSNAGYWRVEDGNKGDLAADLAEVAGGPVFEDLPKADIIIVNDYSAVYASREVAEQAMIQAGYPRAVSLVEVPELPQTRDPVIGTVRETMAALAKPLTKPNLTAAEVVKLVKLRNLNIKMEWDELVDREFERILAEMPVMHAADLPEPDMILKSE